MLTHRRSSVRIYNDQLHYMENREDFSPKLNIV